MKYRMKYTFSGHILEKTSLNTKHEGKMVMTRRNIEEQEEEVSILERIMGRKGNLRALTRCPVNRDLNIQRRDGDKNVA